MVLCISGISFGGPAVSASVTQDSLSMKNAFRTLLSLRASQSQFRQLDCGAKFFADWLIGQHLSPHISRG